MKSAVIAQVVPLAADLNPSTTVQGTVGLEEVGLRGAKGNALRGRGDILEAGNHDAGSGRRTGCQIIPIAVPVQPAGTHGTVVVEVIPVVVDQLPAAADHRAVRAVEVPRAARIAVGIKLLTPAGIDKVAQRVLVHFAALQGAVLVKGIEDTADLLGAAGNHAALAVGNSVGGRHVQRTQIIGIAVPLQPAGDHRARGRIEIVPVAGAVLDPALNLGLVLDIIPLCAVSRALPAVAEHVQAVVDLSIAGHIDAVVVIETPLTIIRVLLTAGHADAVIGEEVKLIVDQGMAAIEHTTVLIKVEPAALIRDPVVANHKAVHVIIPDRVCGSSFIYPAVAACILPRGMPCQTSAILGIGNHRVYSGVPAVVVHRIIDIRSDIQKSIAGNHRRVAVEVDLRQ